MTKSQNTMRALLFSVLSMMLCMIMLVGSTFAWFTDSVSSGMNCIISGNLDIEFEYAAEFNADGSVKKWAPVTAATELFSAHEKDGTTANLWEPGHTEYVCLRIRNAGTLALKYQFDVKVWADKDGTKPEKKYENVDGGKFRLSKYLVFSQTPGAQRVTDRRSLWIEDPAKEKAAMGDLSGLGLSSDKMLPGEEEIVTLAVYMPTQVGNEANYKAGTARPEIYLGLSVVATQTPAESDSFDENYDANLPLSEPPVKTMLVEDQATLDAAFAEIYASDDTVARIVLDDDIYLSAETLEVSGGKDITIDLAGHDLSIARTGYGDGIEVQNGVLTVTNSGDTGEVIFSSDSYKGAAFFVNGGDATLNLENVTVNSSMAYNGVIYAESRTEKKATVNLKGGAKISMACVYDYLLAISSGICASNANVNIHEGALVQVSVDNCNNHLFCINAQNSDISMTGGELSVHSYGSAGPNAAAMALDNCNADISGGVMNLTGNRELNGVLIAGGTVNMTGGTINVDATDIEYYVGAFGIANRDDYVKVNISGGTINVNSTFKPDTDRSDRGGYAVYFEGNEPSYAHSDVTVSGTTEIKLNYDPASNAYNFMCNYDDDRFVDAR